MRSENLLHTYLCIFKCYTEADLKSKFDFDPSALKLHFRESLERKNVSGDNNNTCSGLENNTKFQKTIAK